ncbi:MAG TPA: hypothetical protein EYG82_03720 [Sulfurovum sp.]|nr:hypothetical protein [Sulfurovum sp.]
MKKILTISIATIFLLGCTQQGINAPVSTKNVKQENVAKAKTSNVKNDEVQIDLKKPKSVTEVNSAVEENQNTSTSVQSSEGGFDSSSILSMVGSAVLAGVISGLVSKAIQ